MRSGAGAERSAIALSVVSPCYNQQECLDSMTTGGSSHPLPLQFSQMPRSAQQRLLEPMTAPAPVSSLDGRTAQPAE
jgi:hypothetical protein